MGLKYSIKVLSKNELTSSNSKIKMPVFDASILYVEKKSDIKK